MTVKPTHVSDAPKPVESPDFWRERIYRQYATGGMLHQCIYENSYDVWNYLQGETAGHLRRVLREMNHPSTPRVLDAGCGYGAMLCCFQESGIPVDYVGVDISPDLIRLAELRYCRGDPARWTGEFLVADLKKLPFMDKQFDLCVARSVEGMIQENIGKEAWKAMRGEMHRVAEKVVLINYPVKVGDEITAEVDKL